MNTINRLLLGGIAVLSSALCGCSDGDENLTPGPTFKNYFEVDASDNSPEAQLRREFFNESGVYLLFNDTLAIYTDDYGLQKIETVDFNWNLTGNLDTGASWSYLNTIEDKRRAVEIVKKYFLPFVNNEGCPFKPFSVMLMTDLAKPDRYGDPEPLAYLSCWRCFGINVTDWLTAESSELKPMTRELLYELVSPSYRALVPVLGDFFAPCEEYYDTRIYKSFPEWMEEQDPEIVYKLGFLSYDKDSWGDADYDYFWTEERDAKDFLHCVIVDDESEFLNRWADYPKIIQKYYIMKECVLNFGINLNAVE